MNPNLFLMKVLKWWDDAEAFYSVEIKLFWGNKRMKDVNVIILIADSGIITCLRG